MRVGEGWEDLWERGGESGGGRICGRGEGGRENLWERGGVGGRICGRGGGVGREDLWEKGEEGRVEGERSIGGGRRRETQHA